MRRKRGSGSSQGTELASAPCLLQLLWGRHSANKTFVECARVSCSWTNKIKKISGADGVRGVNKSGDAR